MKRIYSLKGRNLFKEVFHKGRKVQDSGIRVFILKCINSEYVKPNYRTQIASNNKNTKIAITLTKSFGKAHIRNRIKRRIRAICAELFNELQDGFYIILKIDRDFIKFHYDEEKTIIKTLFLKSGIMKR